MEYKLREYEVHKRWDGKYEILKHPAWCKTHAYEVIDGMLLWNTCPLFDSFIQAVRYLKENADNLL